jgi:transglutaminase-like putative cysteine protease
MKQTVKSILFPALLSFVTALSFYCIYEPLRALPLFLIFTSNALLFIVYEKLRIRNKTWFSAIIIIAILVASMTITGQLIGSQGRSSFNHLGDWFFKTGDTPLNYPMFTAALMTAYIPFITSTVFYFTNVRYNSFFVMLTCMTTFALYAKTFTVIPFVFPALIIALFLFVSIEKRWYNLGARKTLSYPKFIATGMCFVALSAYVAGLFPPAESTPYREQFDDFISGGMVRMFDVAGFTFDSNVSGTASSYNMNTDYLLFYIRADSPPGYLRRQVFDNWTGESWLHYTRTRDTWWAISFNEHNEHSVAQLWYEFFNELNKSETEIPESLSFWNQAPKRENKTAEISVITSKDSVFLPLPAAPSRLEYSWNDSVKLRRSIRDEIEITSEEEDFSWRGQAYTVEYFDSRASDEFLSRLTPQVVEELEELGYLFHMHSTFPNYIFPEGYSHVDYQFYLDSCLELNDYNNREKVRELALEITADYESDFEKAKAIEQYFYNGNFRYDLDFTPRSKAVDYFLFESRTGTCSDFATAMVILAREAGLPARYVEGYVTDEQDEGGGYLVRIKHSHAFAEVFINGWGWVIFEPTIPESDSNRGDFNYFALLTVLISIGALGIISVLFAVLALPRIRERKFRKLAMNSPREKQIQLIYNKIYTEFMKAHRLPRRTLSSRDLDSLAQSQYGINLSSLTDNYDRVVYGGIPAAADGDFYATYLKFCEMVKQKRK